MRKISMWRTAIYVAVTLISAYGLFIEPHWIEVTEHHLGKKLPIKIAQVSDVHLSPWNMTTSGIYSKLSAIQPDVIVLTGDIADSPDDLDGSLQTFLTRLPKVEIIAILGNWEHWSELKIDELKKLYGENNVKLLINEIHTHNGVQFVGLDDSTGGNLDLKVVNKLDPRMPVVVLEHSPGRFDQIVRFPPSQRESITMLSGHTHGGQVSLLGITPVIPPGSGPYVRGWYKEGQGSQLYVSRGLGSSLLNFRLGARPEIAVFQ